MEWANCKAEQGRQRNRTPGAVHGYTAIRTDPAGPIGDDTSSRSSLADDLPQDVRAELNQLRYAQRQTDEEWRRRAEAALEEKELMDKENAEKENRERISREAVEEYRLKQELKRVEAEAEKKQLRARLEAIPGLSPEKVEAILRKVDPSTAESSNFGANDATGTGNRLSPSEKRSDDSSTKFGSGSLSGKLLPFMRKYVTSN